MSDENATYQEYMRRMREHADTEGIPPIIDDNNLSVPIQRSGAIGDSYADDLDSIDIESYEDLELEFIQCEKCQEWLRPTMTRLVQTFKSFILETDIEDQAVKTLSVEPQTWCLDCILGALNASNEIEKHTKSIDEEINKIRMEKQKIKRIQDDVKESIEKRDLMKQRESVTEMPEQENDIND